MAELLVLRLVHIAGGVFWAGTIFFFVLFLEPTLRAAGAEGGRTMMRLASSAYPKFIATMAILTLLSGFRMYMIVGGGNSAFYSSRMGMALGVGGLSALLAFVLGLAINLPAGKRMGQLAQEIQAGGGVPTDAQAAAVQAVRMRLVTTTRVIAALLLVTVVTMATARYLG